MSWTGRRGWLCTKLVLSSPKLVRDRYARKWPFVINYVLFIILELGTGFCQTFQHVPGLPGTLRHRHGRHVRQCGSHCLEECPLAARGIISGLSVRHGLRSCSCGYNLPRMTAALLVRSMSTSADHPIQTHPTGKRCLPESRDGAQSWQGNHDNLYPRNEILAQESLVAPCVHGPPYCRAELSNAWNAGPLPTHAEIPVRFLAQWRDCHQCDRQPRRLCRRSYLRLDQRHLRPTRHADHHLRGLSGITLPLHIHVIPRQRWSRFLRAILHRRGHGRGSDPPPRTVSRITTHFECRRGLPACESDIVSELDHRSHARRAVPARANEQRCQEISLWEGCLYFHGVMSPV